MINFDKIPKDRVSYGSTVIVYDVQKNTEVTYRLVSTEESNIKKGLISTTSPIGRGLLNKKEGDMAKANTPAGIKEFEIIKLTTLHNQKKKIT